MLCAGNNDITQRGVARASLYVGFGGRVEGDLPELYPHAQVLPDGRHQRRAHDVHQPPRQRRGEARVVDPAAQQVEEVNGDGEIQALLPSPDEVQQAQSTGECIEDESHHGEPPRRG